ncbi:ribonuclease Z [Fredinandcohnia sp. 179-A 10B2 NHS]|uniref:ribonuclease Z n=1 Tax=Fredinandcohnia sp. 179-A 10B2 NHS TaxID=3235176 RepID=UPI0039A00614
MEVVFLGTGAGVPAKERNVTSIALQLLEERRAAWLFDCGEATQHQILYTSIKPRRIEKIFITHLHGDHIFGLPGFLGSRSFQGGEALLTIYGPKGIKTFVDTSLKVSGTHLRYPLEVVEIEEGIIFEDDQFYVEARELEHGIQVYGYRIVEKDLPGTLLVDKLMDEGIKPGPLYQRIKEGKTVILENGKEINGKEYIGPSKKGRIITILGDTRYCQKSIELAKDADLLIHEATFSSNEAELAYDYFHSTTTQAAEVAKQANAKTLVLTHISSRYQGEDSQQLLKEACTVFSPTYIAKDFMKYEINSK